MRDVTFRLRNRPPVRVLNVALCALFLQSSWAGETPAPAVTMKMAYATLGAGKTLEALSNFESIIQKDSQNLEALLGQAMVFSKLKRHPEAFDAYDSLIQKMPNNAFAWNGRGLAALNLDAYDVALNSFKEASDKLPNGLHYESLAWTFMCLGEYEQAAIHAKRANLYYTRDGELTLYPLLIAYFSHHEAGAKSQASQTLDYLIANLTNEDWPYPIIKYLVGHIDASELISLVQNLSMETEVHAYIALKLRSQDKPAEAAKHLKWVQGMGEHSLFESILARSMNKKDSLALLVK